MKSEGGHYVRSLAVRSNVRAHNAVQRDVCHLCGRLLAGKESSRIEPLRNENDRPEHAVGRHARIDSAETAALLERAQLAANQLEIGTLAPLYLAAFRRRQP